MNNESNSNKETYFESLNPQIDTNQEFEDKRERLETLREMTRLNPIDYVKILKARKTAEKFRDLYIQDNPSDIIEVDYSTANELEYALRMFALQKGCERGWQEYIAIENDGYGLSEFTESVLDEEIRKKHQRKHRK